jgi:hypothetical protein
VNEVRFEAGRGLESFITCPAGVIPCPGQYLLASDHNDTEAVLGTPLFLAERTPQGFWTATPFQTAWEPGTSLGLVGPLGHGFDLPHIVQRLGLVALGDTISRLLPLIHQTTQSPGGMTLFTDLPLPVVPASLEVYPLASLVEMLDWPDFMAIDLPLERLSELRAVFGIPDGAGMPCPAQVLVTTPMPCAGLASCGACAVPARRGWKLACEDGPVFDLQLLKW